MIIVTVEIPTNGVLILKEGIGVFVFLCTNIGLFFMNSNEFTMSGAGSVDFGAGFGVGELGIWNWAASASVNE